jgi:hypothetical protein
MALKQVEYKGRWITIDVFQRGKGWSWSYQIDNGPMRECDDRPLRSENLILGEAEEAAKREIDRAEKRPTE